MKILLTGGTGQVGNRLLPELRRLGQVWAPQRSEFDLSTPERLRTGIREFSPDLIVNAGAYTSVEKAEEEVDLCFKINCGTPRVLAEESSILGIPMIHYSTDYVFDGKKAEPYIEQDAPNPLNVYGESKLQGELAVLETNEKSYVLRTSWVFDPTFGNNFYRTMKRLFAEKSVISVVDDQYGRPTSVKFLVDHTIFMIRNSLIQRDKPRIDLTGLYHLAEMQKMSWFEFASWILDQENSAKFMCTAVKKISASHYPTKAKRPTQSVLCCDKWLRAVKSNQRANFGE